MAQRSPGAGLISWNGISFTRGRSKLMPFTGAAPTQKSVVAGVGFKVDRAGSTVAPLEMNVQYEYLIVGSTFAAAQTEMDALWLKFLTSPVGTLTTFGAGNYSDEIIGLARLENIAVPTDAENYKIVQLSFFCEAGMS